MIKIDIEKTDLRIKHGDIIRNVECIERVSEEGGQLIISKIVFPLAIVLSQDCDLEQDYKDRTSQKSGDKMLISALVAPLYNVEHVYSGDHLSELNRSMQTINRNRTQGKMLLQNKNPRYHYLEFEPTSNLVPSVVDFKHYFCIAVEELERGKNQNFVCCVLSPYREDIAQRFASFLARIALP